MYWNKTNVMVSKKHKITNDTIYYFKKDYLEWFANLTNDKKQEWLDRGEGYDPDPPSIKQQNLVKAQKENPWIWFNYDQCQHRFGDYGSFYYNHCEFVEHRYDSICWETEQFFKSYSLSQYDKYLKDLEHEYENTSLTIIRSIFGNKNIKISKNDLLSLKRTADFLISLSNCSERISYYTENNSWPHMLRRSNEYFEENMNSFINNITKKEESIISNLLDLYCTAYQKNNKKLKIDLLSEIRDCINTPTMPHQKIAKFYNDTTFVESKIGIINDVYQLINATGRPKEDIYVVENRMPGAGFSKQ
jgi:hypothetical protein